MKVLIVDDEPLARMRLKSMLEHLGFNDVLEANHGREGMNMATEYLPDLIFMDIEMPEMNGIEAASQIKQNHPSMPIIFSTAHDEFALKAFDLSAADYLLKPLSLERLKQAIEKVGFTDSHDKIQVKRGTDVFLLAASDVICLLAEDKYVTAYLSKQAFLLDQSLAELENKYPLFIRIHRNALINPNFLTGIHNAPGQLPQCVLEHIELKPTISRRQLPAVRKLLKQI
ncbi:LytTR family DNA-binding domain-containing protein [Marinicella sp. S1101]|uniref:LytR/AlgR family response regulator transcription factor n=1 Tax=Marinicella marina TaxID=2996016 RepID=UPI002260DD1E|nr:LytTR family DNA-binding domain-containing protein [Marinicella marina]MCX7552776.1 LytTR family DNA-binding domain-containing protein [Marinicella marina]MDJ1139915.1 LytTR family DNA-binding domain-containing protein [Marinicella marina]